MGQYFRSVDALQQAQGADRGTAGMGVDSGGMQLRDWASYPILARINGHVLDNSYGFVEVYIDGTTGLPVDTPGGLESLGIAIPAYEANGVDTVADDTIVELWPNYSTPGSLTFVVSGGASNRGLADSSVHAVAGSGWPTDPLDVFFRRVDRTNLGELQEASPPVEYGKRPILVSSTSAGSSDTNAVTTGSISTTGASGIFLVAAWDPTTTADAVVTDSLTNTWVGLTAQTSGVRKVRIFYSANPSVGGTQTFTVTAASGKPTVAVAAFSGIHLTPFDVQNGNTGAAITTLATGSVTPTVPYSVAIAGLSANDSSGTPATIDSSYTAVTVGQNANHVAGGLAWKILASSAIQNPSWTWTNAGVAAAAIAVFKGTGPVYEHANLPWRCVDPDDGTVTHQIPLFKDDRNILYAEWPDWPGSYQWVYYGQITSITQNEDCTFIWTQEVVTYEVRWGFHNTPTFSIEQAVVSFDCVDDVCVQVEGSGGAYPTAGLCGDVCPP
jgi:hypothetical protein